MLSLLLILSSVCLLWSKAEGQFSGSVRLVARNGRTSSTLTAGRLEAYYNGQWGTVCDDSFGISEAHTACRQLGFSLGYLNYGTAGGSVLGFPPASSSTPIWLDDLYCSSFATSLSQCTSRGIGVHNCGHNEDVTLSCLGNGALRLRGSSLSSYSSNHGRLEVYYNGVWGTVCNYRFGQTDADVACRQLGYASASNYGTVGSLGYSQGSGTIWLDGLQCTSSDLMLSMCSHNGFGNGNYCYHYEDVAVSCSNDVDVSGSIRLVARNNLTSSNLTAGRLEVYYNGQWGTVCDDSFGISEARTACRQLEFSLGYLNYGTAGGSVLGFPPASSSTPIWLDDLYCSSSATSLSQCTSRGIGVHNCGHNEDVTLSCLGNGALRLRGSSLSSYSLSHGRLEVYYNGVWGTVCNDLFGQTDADVACRQLGYASASNYGSVGSLGYSQGSGTIWLDDLQCTSSDLMLSMCSHNGFGNDNCYHYEDVAVSCGSAIYDSHDLQATSISGAAIAGIVIGVFVPLCCIGVCVLIVIIAVCTGACAAGQSNHSGNRHNFNVVTTTVGKPAATATVMINASPPYPGLKACAAQPQTGYPQFGYPLYPAGGNPQAALQPYPDLDEKSPSGQVELQQYPAQAVPDQMAPYPTAGHGYKLSYTN